MYRRPFLLPSSLFILAFFSLTQTTHSLIFKISVDPPIAQSGAVVTVSWTTDTVNDPQSFFIGGQGFQDQQAFTDGNLSGNLSYQLPIIGPGGYQLVATDADTGDTLDMALISIQDQQTNSTASGSLTASSAAISPSLASASTASDQTQSSSNPAGSSVSESSSHHSHPPSPTSDASTFASPPSGANHTVQGANASLSPSDTLASPTDSTQTQAPDPSSSVAAAAGISSTSKHGLSTGAMVGIAVGVVALLVSAVSAFIMIRRQRASRIARPISFNRDMMIRPQSTLAPWDNFEGSEGNLIAKKENAEGYRDEEESLASEKTPSIQHHAY